MTFLPEEHEGPDFGEIPFYAPLQGPMLLPLRPFANPLPDAAHPRIRITLVMTSEVTALASQSSLYTDLPALEEHLSTENDALLRMISGGENTVEECTAVRIGTTPHIRITLVMITEAHGPIAGPSVYDDLPAIETLILKENDTFLVGIEGGKKTAAYCRAERI